jgi:beta-lactamase superfamily II metal-dependent hydrolase
MKIINYEIEMLSVGAADAFIIHFTDDSQVNHLILIDAGNYEDGQMITDHLRKYYTNPIINLAIVTHPDDDHYGGFIKMLEKIQNKDKDAIKINKFWINDPGNNHVDKNEVKWITKQKSVNVRARSVFDLNDKNLIELIDSILGNSCREEKFTQLGTLKIREKILNYIKSDVTYPFFKILGPTKSYYESLVPNFRNDELNFHTPENDSNYVPSRDIPNETCLSPTLDNAVDDSSANNQSSLILLFEPNNEKKYLFFGDAGRDAFNKMPSSAKNSIHEKIYWIKVPHHGSKHNLDSAMINWMKPKIAYISTECIGNFLNQCTVNALKASKCSVYSTHLDKCHFLHNGNREDYSSATPL